MSKVEIIIYSAAENYSRYITPEQVSMLSKVYEFPEKIKELSEHELLEQMKGRESMLADAENESENNEQEDIKNLLLAEEYYVLGIELFFRSKGSADKYRLEYYAGDIERNRLGEFLDWVESQKERYGEDWAKFVPQGEWFKWREVTLEEGEARSRNLEIKDEAMRMLLNNPEDTMSKPNQSEVDFSNAALIMELEDCFPELSPEQFNFAINHHFFRLFLLFEKFEFHMSVFDEYIFSNIIGKEFNLLDTKMKLFERKVVRGVDRIKSILKARENNSQLGGSPIQQKEEIKDDDDDSEGQIDNKADSPEGVFKRIEGRDMGDNANFIPSSISVR